MQERKELVQAVIEHVAQRKCLPTSASPEKTEPLKSEQIEPLMMIHSSVLFRCGFIRSFVSLS